MVTANTRRTEGVESHPLNHLSLAHGTAVSVTMAQRRMQLTDGVTSGEAPDQGDPGPTRRASGVLAAKLRAPRAEALPRERLDDLLSGLWTRRLALVVAPAGSGKTTLFVRFAATAGVPVAWYRPETWDGALDVFLGYLQAALRTAVGGLPGRWTSVEEAA